MATHLLPYIFLLMSAFSLELTLNQHVKQLIKGSFPVLQQGASPCARYMCKPSSVTMAPNSCLHLENNTYYIQPCTNRVDGLTYCPTLLDYQQDDNVCQEPVPDPPGNIYPGEKCTTNSSCVNDYCSEKTGLCVGLNQGEACIDDQECSGGLFCEDDGFCVPQLNEGETCSTDYQCSNSHGCSIASGDSGVCLPYFSVPIGGSVNACYGVSSHFCATGTCQMSTFGKGTCISPITSTSSIPMSCQYDHDCTGTSGGLSFQSSCQCGYTPVGTAYCYPFLGDAVGKNYFDYWTQLVQTNATQQCNTFERFSINCLLSLSVSWGKQQSPTSTYSKTTHSCRKMMTV